MPSKGVRDALADALNLWAGLPETAVTRIKKVINDLHTASLMYVSLVISPIFILSRFGINEVVRTG